MHNFFKKILTTVDILISLMAASALTSEIITSNKDDNKNYKCENDENTFNYISNSITDDKSLSENQKIYLLNERFLNDMLYYDKYDSINENVSVFNNMNINSYEETEDNKYINGYYQRGGNSIYIKNYKNKSFCDYQNVLTHEFVHMFQNKFSEPNYINEALAEILSYEYYGCNIESYVYNVINVKLIMELIGTDAIIDFMFTNDYSKIENKLNKYLNDIELINVMDILKYHNNNDFKYEDNLILNNILKDAFHRIDKDKIFEITNQSIYMTDYNKYYFNTDKIDDLNNNYYLDYNYYDYTLYGAYVNNIINFYKIEKSIEKIDIYDKYLSYNISGNIYDNVVVLDDNLIIKSYNANYGVNNKINILNVEVSGTYNGIEFTCSLLDLFKAELIDIYYERYTYILINYQEYLNCISNNDDCVIELESKYENEGYQLELLDDDYLKVRLKIQNKKVYLNFEDNDEKVRERF